MNGRGMRSSVPGRIAQSLDQLDDIRDSIRAQFSHDAASLSLDGSFRGSQLCGNLFVQQAVRDMQTNLALSA